MNRRRHNLAATLSCCLTALILGPATAQDSTEKETPGGGEPALEGYCPASYVKSGEAVQGQPEFEITHQGKTYHCASEEARQAFEAEPERYLPQFDGLCTAAMGGRFGNWLFADPTVFDVYNGKLYLFSSERAKRAYEEDKTRYVARAEIVFETKPKTPRAPRTDGDKAAQPQQPAVLELVGSRLPSVELTLRDGSQVSTGEIRNPATLLMFYASWCPHCQKALPQIEALHNAEELSQARIMAVSLDQLRESGAKGRHATTRDAVVKQYTDLGLSLPLAFADPVLARGVLKVSSYPTLFLVGGTGKIERVYRGAPGATDGSIRNDILALLASGSLPEPDKSGHSPVALKNSLKLAGQRVPDAFFLSTLDGSKVNLSQPKSGEITVAFFYVSHSKYSLDALKIVNEYAKAYDGQPVRFYGICMDSIASSRSDLDPRVKTRDDVIKQWKDGQYKFVQLLDTERAGRRDFKVKNYPTIILINKQARIEQVYIGMPPVREGTLKTDLKNLLGKP